MIISQEHINWMKEVWVEKSITDMAQKWLDVQNYREALCQSLFKMNEFAQQKIREGEYDAFLSDTNGLIDQVQIDMQELENNQTENEEI